MSEDKDKTIINPEGAQPEESKAKAEETPAKGGLFANKKVLIFGGGGLLVLILAIVALFLLMGGDEPTAEAGDQSTEISESGRKEESEESKSGQAEANKPGKAEKSEKTDNSQSEKKSDMPRFDDPAAFEWDESELANLDLGLTDEEMSALDQIEANLNYLDQPPADRQAGSAGQAEMISAEDSIEEVNWLEEENNKLAVREKNVTEREKSVQRLEKEVSRKIIIIEQAESSRIAKLAKLYDGMDPRSVTKLMNNLDDDTVVSLISRMKMKNASQVLSLLSPQRAARLSKKMITIAEN